MKDAVGPAHPCPATSPDAGGLVVPYLDYTLRSSPLLVNSVVLSKGGVSAQAEGVFFDAC